MQISDSADDIEEKCRKAVSDTEARLSYDHEKRPAISNLVASSSLFVSAEMMQSVRFRSISIEQ